MGINNWVPVDDATVGDQDIDTYVNNAKYYADPKVPPNTKLYLFMKENGDKFILAHDLSSISLPMSSYDNTFTLSRNPIKLVDNAIYDTATRRYLVPYGDLSRDGCNVYGPEWLPAIYGNYRREDPVTGSYYWSDDIGDYENYVITEINKRIPFSWNHDSPYYTGIYNHTYNKIHYKNARIFANFWSYLGSGGNSGGADSTKGVGVDAGDAGVARAPSDHTEHQLYMYFDLAGDGWFVITANGADDYMQDLIAWTDDDSRDRYETITKGLLSTYQDAARWKWEGSKGAYGIRSQESDDDDDKNRYLGLHANKHPTIVYDKSFGEWEKFVLYNSIGEEVEFKDELDNGKYSLYNIYHETFWTHNLFNKISGNAASAFDSGKSFYFYWDSGYLLLNTANKAGNTEDVIAWRQDPPEPVRGTLFLFQNAARWKVDRHGENENSVYSIKSTDSYADDDNNKKHYYFSFWGGEGKERIQALDEPAIWEKFQLIGEDGDVKTDETPSGKICIYNITLQHYWYPAFNASGDQT